MTVNNYRIIVAFFGLALFAISLFLHLVSPLTVLAFSCGGLVGKSYGVWEERTRESRHD